MTVTLKRDKRGEWACDGQQYGVRVRRRFAGRTKKQAQEEMDALVEAVRKEWLERKRLGGMTEEEARPKTFEEAVAGYKKDGGRAKNVDKAEAHFKGVPVAKITPMDVREFARKHWPDATGATRNSSAIVPVRAVINWAHGQGWCGPIKVKGFETEKPVRKTVTRGWLARFDEVGKRRPTRRDRWLGLMAYLMSSTGMRIGECCAMRVDWIEWTLKAGGGAEAKIRLPKTKNGKQYVVVVPPFLVEDLLELRADREEAHGKTARIFAFKGRQWVYEPWKAVCFAAGIDYVPPHQAGRHTFATELHNRFGWTASDIAKAGRWESVGQVIDTYIHSEKESAAAGALFGK